ncbi:uncharacterized protein [Nicotiana tomentosiformis]|uniref:uncharacterized protein n=1 Tax=Nicotiana tomentosiformis TaxID=4098 RepID=UPI00388C59D2
MELKPLPAHLHYDYLGSAETFPVVISSSLINLQEEKLLRVLHEHKRASEWTITDIKGISPSFCMHKYFLEDGHCPSVEQQRRLNPIMKEVVKKEIIKWLDAGIIFPISDSNWMLDKLAGHEYYCILDGYSGFNQIVIAPNDQEKTTLHAFMSFKEYIEVDKAKVEAVAKCRHHLCDWFLEKNVVFKLGAACLKLFDELKKRLVAALIIVQRDWSLPFKLMCDARDHAISALLGQRKDKIFHPIYNASKTLDDAQLNYITIEKELLPAAWALEKF